MKDEVTYNVFVLIRLLQLIEDHVTTLHNYNPASHLRFVNTCDFRTLYHFKHSWQAAHHVTCTCILLHVCVWLLVYTDIYLCIPVYSHWCIPVYTGVCLCLLVYTCIYWYTPLYTYAYWCLFVHMVYDYLFTLLYAYVAMRLCVHVILLTPIYSSILF